MTNKLNADYKDVRENMVSDVVYIMKAFAILSVALAHSPCETANVRQAASIIGTIGVPIFFITGGVYFNSGQPWNMIIRKKFKRIIIPWIIWGMVTYLLHIYRGKSAFSFPEYILWILGSYTWLYFVPVILFCYVIYNISIKNWYLVLCMGICIVSNILTMFGLLDNIGLTWYQNPFNWIGFFAFGIFLQKCNIRSFIPSNKLIKTGAVFFGAALIICSKMYYEYSYTMNFNPSYWTRFSFVFEMIGLLFCYFTAFVLVDNKISQLLVDIGKNSYVLYFAHMQIGINIVNMIFSMLKNYVIYLGMLEVIIRGVIIIVVTYLLCVVLVKKIMTVLKLEKFMWIIGL